MLFFKKKQDDREEMNMASENEPCGVVASVSVEQGTIRPQMADTYNDDMARDLAVLIGDAITVWTQKYHLENLPRGIILDQAISILSAVRDII